MFCSHKSIIVLLFIFCTFLTEANAQHSEWQSLIDPQLSAWETYLSYKHETTFNGKTPKGPDGKNLDPIGYNSDDHKVFTYNQQENAIRISGEYYGCIFTKQEFDNYHLKVKVKWGAKKWIPREDKLKDSGILYHSIGKCGVDYWLSWMLSQEFQIMEGHMGDYWNIANSSIEIKAFPSEGNMNAVADAKAGFIPIGTRSPIGSFCLRSDNKENTSDAWTLLELICFEGKSIHLVNGHVVMILRNSSYIENETVKPLKKGKIQLQSEGAEVYFKDMEIKSIDDLPSNYLQYFN